MSWVSHQKAEKGGVFLANLLALSFCQLNTVVFHLIRKTNQSKSAEYDLLRVYVADMVYVL